MSKAVYRLSKRAGHARGGSALEDESGFSLIEVVMAIFIFGMVITGIAAGMMSTLNLTRQDKNRSVGSNLASQEMDLVRSTDFTSLPLGQDITTQTVDGVVYTIDRETEWVTQNATSGPCQAPPGSNLAYLAVAVSVSWPNMAGVKPPQANTVVAPPVGTFDPNNGHIAVTVRDFAGNPQDGIDVTISGASVNDTQTTANDGCAFFAYEPPGPYTVSLSEPGMVSDQGVASPSQSATVQTGSIVSVQFQYDTAASLIVTLAGNTGGVVPNNVPLGLWNTHTLPAGVKMFPGSGNPRTITGLFPFSDGYEVWAGSCLDANPEGTDSSGTVIYPGAQRLGPLTTPPGGTTPATLNLPEVLVTTQTAGGVLRPGVVVTATHVAPTAPLIETGCPSGETYVLGTTNASGQLLAALPFGSWNITAPGSTPSSAVGLSPLNGSAPTPKTVTVP
jgi:prepilin-type N-terminal cleavage/methylation domain-containing protein